MKSASVFIAVIILFIGGLSLYKNSNNFSKNTNPIDKSINASPGENNKDSQKSSVIATNLDTPWAIAFLPDNNVLVTERAGRVRLINNSGKLEKTPVAIIDKVKEIGEGGLLGMTPHPDFTANNFIYLYYTYQGSGNDTLNRVVRMVYKDKKLSDEKLIVDKIPGASNHNGGRIKFGPDKLLYITTGDAQEPSRAQDKNSLAGKILRITDEGKLASGNPFNNPVYSFGHRNPQGLVWDNRGRLWSTEHGRSGLQSGFDELNLIEPGRNYGWPDIQGDETKQGMVKPVVHSGATNTWAPGGVAIDGNTLYFTGLRGSALYRFNIDSNNIEELLKNEFGRIRDVVKGPDGMFYITTSNLDGRGNPKDGDDKIIRINPSL